VVAGIEDRGGPALERGKTEEGGIAGTEREHLWCGLGGRPRGGLRLTAGALEGHRGRGGNVATMTGGPKNPKVLCLNGSGCGESPLVCGGDGGNEVP